MLQRLFSDATGLREVEMLFDEVFTFFGKEFCGNEPSTIQLRKNYAYYLYAKLKNCEKVNFDLLITFF